MNQAVTQTTSISHNKIISICLLVLIATFATLAPGGPIENRDFSHLSPLVFWGFNALLISLAAIGILMIFWTWKGKIIAFWVSIAVAWLYIFVFILDWAHVFPTSPDQIGLWLGLIEIMDAILCFYIILLAHKTLHHI